MRVVASWQVELLMPESWKKQLGAAGCFPSLLFKLILEGRGCPFSTGRKGSKTTLLRFQQLWPWALEIDLD